MAGQQAQITEEVIMKGACSLLAAGTLLCLLTNTALADDNSISSEARQNHSLLSIWDKPAFSPAPNKGLVPRPDSRPAKGQQVDFLLLRPDRQDVGPLLAQKGNSLASSATRPLQIDDYLTAAPGWRRWGAAPDQSGG
jgi:hypothetical protein